MPNQTTRYNLTKPLTSEFYDVAVPNANNDILDVQEVIHRVTATGTGDAITATVSNLLVYYNGLGVTFEVAADNTGAATINVNGLGAKALERVVNNIVIPLTSGDLKIGDQIIASYDSGLDKFIIQVSTNERFYRDERVSNSYALDLQEAYEYVKTADDGQDVGDWTVDTGTLSQDTTNVKIGSGSIRITENDATAGLIRSYKNALDINLTTLNNGEISTDDDYIVMPVYISDVSAIDLAGGVQVFFSQDTPFTSTNTKFKSFTSGLITGWNYLKAKKSEFTTQNTGAWENIQSIRISWQSKASQAGEYVSFQLIQLVAKDAVGDYPNPLSSQGWTINSGEWFVGEEFGQIVCKSLASDAIDVDTLQSNKTYTNFITTASVNCGQGDDAGYLTWYQDSDNYVIAQILNDKFTITTRVGGSNTNYQDPKNINIAIGDRVDFYMEKSGTLVIGRAVINGEIYSVSIDVSQASGTYSLGVRYTSTEQYFYASSITQIPHAHHADIAEVAKGLTEQPYGAWYLSSNQLIPDSTFTELAFDLVEYDNEKISSPNDNERVIQESGLYLITAKVRWLSNATGWRIAIIKVDGTEIARDLKGDSGTAVYTSPQEMFRLSSGAIVTVEVYQNSTAALDVVSSTFTDCSLSIAKMG